LVDGSVFVSGREILPVPSNAAREDHSHEEYDKEEGGDGDRELGDDHDGRVVQGDPDVALLEPIL
jgi:hypothetical protein